MRRVTIAGLSLIMSMLTACVKLAASPVPTTMVETLPSVASTSPAPSSTLESSPTPTLVVSTATSETNPTGIPLPTTIAPTVTIAPTPWEDLPIVPESVSNQMKEVYLRGISSGNNPAAFSKVGDCGSTPAWFLGDFDRGEAYYDLGDFSYLDEVIEAFHGSYGRTSLAAKSGFNASSIFTTLWADRNFCQPNETPLACEYRIHKPTFAFVTLGSNDVWHKDKFEPQMRKLIEFSLENGVIPILATKADNDEGDHSINATIAQLGYEYSLPVWNYWRAVQDLPDHGLQEDGVHLTWGPNRFNDPQVLQRAWPVRNLTALQVIDIVWKTVSQ